MRDQRRKHDELLPTHVAVDIGLEVELQARSPLPWFEQLAEVHDRNLVRDEFLAVDVFHLAHHLAPMRREVHHLARMRREMRQGLKRCDAAACLASNTHTRSSPVEGSARAGTRSRQPHFQPSWKLPPRPLSIYI